MIAGMQRRAPKLSARKLAHMNAEQAVVNLDMVKRNELQQDRRKELENEIEAMRETARRALEHRFSPHTWHRALVQIARPVEEAEPGSETTYGEGSES